MPHFQDVITASTAAEITRLAQHIRRAQAAHHEHERQLIENWYWAAVASGRLESVPRTSDEMRECLASIGHPTSDPFWADWYAQWMVDHACERALGLASAA